MFSAILASAGSLDYGRIFADLAIILVVAKLAAELFERIRVPAVLGEIIAGVVIGPSMLGLIAPSDAMKILAEIGVIILLAEVGMEMDLRELQKVGRASMLVAIIGVVVPMSSGILAGTLLGESLNASLFLGAALAATSVGITARVFGDLRALASTEARIVLGAAVADDVFGLIILTVVTRIVQQGSIDLIGLLSTIGLAIGFLAVSGIVGLVIVPRVFSYIGVRSMSPATIGVIAAGLTFGFSAAANQAQLAPIIGAFVAGVSLGTTSQHDRISRDFRALGSIFIPVFFLQIGIDTDVTKFFSTHVLLVAAILTAVAVVGKVVSAVGAFGTNTDKILIGLGMIPRGEVGLIFASIGVTIGVFNQDLYAVVLLMVLLTTVITPPLLRWRLLNTTDDNVFEDSGLTTVEPPGGWIRLDGDTVQTSGAPASSLTLSLALQTALFSAHAQPSDELLDLFHERRNVALSWNAESTQLFLDLLMRGNGRSWRFLELAGIIDRALPEVAAFLRKKRADSFELDPTHIAEFPTIEFLRSKITQVTAENSSLLLAAFVSDLGSLNEITESLTVLTIPDSTIPEVRALLSASALLYSAATAEIPDSNSRVLAQIADFLGTPQLVEQCRMLTEASGTFEDWQYSVLLDITTAVQGLLAHPELIEGLEGSVESIRRREAIALTDDPMVADRLSHASAVYILAHSPEVLVRHATLVEPAPRGHTARVGVHKLENKDEWEIDIATKDMQGLLAKICAVLAERGLDIVTADLATWPDGAVLDSFVVRSAAKPNAVQLAYEFESRFKQRLESSRRLIQGSTSGLVISLDNDAHPWHSVVSVSGVDQHGLVQAIATAFARSNINVHHARIATNNDNAVDRFEVSTRLGRKIGPQALAKVTEYLS